MSPDSKAAPLLGLRRHGAAMASLLACAPCPWIHGRSRPAHRAGKAGTCPRTPKPRRSLDCGGVSGPSFRSVAAHPLVANRKSKIRNQKPHYPRS